MSFVNKLFTTEICVHNSGYPENVYGRVEEREGEGHRLEMNVKQTHLCNTHIRLAII